MAIFVIISQLEPSSEQLASAVQATYEGRHLSVAPGVWLITDSGTPHDVSNRLGVTDGENGAAIVTEVAGYYGRATLGVWDWFRANWGNGSRGN